MDNTSENQPTRRPRPFVGGRPPTRPEPVGTTSLQRPFPIVMRRDGRARAATETLATATRTQGDTPRWSVAVYEPGLEHVDGSTSQALEVPAPACDVTDASLALADAVRDAGRHASSVDAAEILESVAHRLRRGEILLPAGTSPRNEVAVVAAVLAALLGERR